MKIRIEGVIDIATYHCILETVIAIENGWYLDEVDEIRIKI